MQQVFDYWSHLLCRKSVKNVDQLILTRNNKPIFDTNLLIYPKEIENCQSKKQSAAGPDGLAVRDVNRIGIRFKCKLFSLFLLLHWIPDILLDSFTIFIPKKNNVKNPASLRPLSISSNLTRLFHKVLVNRLSPLFNPDSYQFGFRPADGVARGIDVLDSVITTCMKDLKPLSIAILDLEKAFDSINHTFIVKCLSELGIPDGIVDYLIYVYKHAKTSLSFKGISSDPLHPSQGVRQGDPLSPFLFLLVFNKVLEALPKNLGIKFGDILLNHIAFADDLVLLAKNIKESSLN